MIFGKSLFESVLSRIEEEDPAPEAEEQTAHRIMGLSTAFVAPALEGVSVSLARVGDGYRDLDPDEFVSVPEEAAAPEPEPVAPEPVAPPHLTRLSPAEIREDLGLTPSETLASLQEKRRLFARENHPDLMHPAHRHAATERMMIANLMIDDAMRRIEAMANLGLR